MADNMKVIEKKLWPDYFDADRNSPLDCKLADFDLQPGDQIKFREWNPETKKYTGREYVRTVKKVLKQETPERYWTSEQLKEHGIHLIQWND
jgi:hypothetical protein